MNTENVQSEEHIMAQIVSMDEEKQIAFKVLIMAILRLMNSEEGCGVMALDVEGNGKVIMSVLGNAMLAPHLTRAMADVMGAMDDTQGPMQ